MSPSCLPLLLVAVLLCYNSCVSTLHLPGSAVASGPLTECAKCLCCPIHLLGALNCSPSFPVFLTSPHALCLMDSCSQSCQFQLSLGLRLQSDRTHKSLWQGKDLGRDKGQRADAAQWHPGSQCPEPADSLSPGSAKCLCCVRGPWQWLCVALWNVGW